MKLDLVEKLLDAGFSKDEIIQLARDEPIKKPDPKPDHEPKPDQEPDQEPNPEPDQEPNPEPDPEPKPTVDETEKRLSGIEKNISDLVKAIQLQNLKRDSFNGNPDSLDEQTDKIMMGIIRPETERKDDKR